MDALITQILGDVRGIAQDVLRREGTRLRTATVASTGPLRITYDGEADPSVVSPRSVLTVALGDRVVVAKARGQATILGTFKAPGWHPLAYASGMDHAGHGFVPSVQRDGTRRYMRGRFARVNGDAFTSQQWQIATLDPEDRPANTVGGIAQVSSFADPGIARVEIYSSGTVYVAPSKDTSWIGMDSITWDVT